MIKTVTLLKRRPDLTPEEFHRYWRDVHAPLMLAVPGCVRYIQGRPVPGYRDADIDGVAEVWYSDEHAMLAAFRTPQYAALIADEVHFMAAQTDNLIFLTLHEDVLRDARGA